MTIDINDPRLTAFALGELPKEEAAEFEAAVKNDPALTAEVKAIREVADKLKTKLAEEPLPKTDSLRPLKAAKNPKGFRRRFILYGSGVAVSLLVVGIVFTTMSLRQPLAYNEYDHAELECRLMIDDSKSSIAKTEEAPQSLEGLRYDNSRVHNYEPRPHFVANQTPAGRPYTSQIESINYDAMSHDEKHLTLPTAKPSSSTEELQLAEKTLNQSQIRNKLENEIRKKRTKLYKLAEELQAADSEAVKVQGIVDIKKLSELRKAQLRTQKDLEEAKIASKMGDAKAVAQVKTLTKQLQDMSAQVDAQKEKVSKIGTSSIDLKELGEELEALSRALENTYPTGPHNTESYDKIVENEFKRVAEHPLSTFSIDVDTASYSMVRKMLTQGRMPVPGAVRLEEMINYFDYSYQPPGDGKPFATHVDAARCPWNARHNLVRIGLKGRVIDKKEREPANLVFLLDVSGSMSSANKLPLLKDAMKMLVENLNARDRVAIVVYAGASGLVLPSTGCDDKHKILESLDRLQSGGSTNGGAGIRLAYATAAANYIEKGVNRVILCTDGDFNVGTTNQSELVSMIEKKAREGVFLTVLGFGMGNYKDSTLEKLADKGNGNYGYVDTINEAKKLLVEGLSGTLVTIAKDVKIQVEFNPHHVKAYRLLGYENRMLRKEDFNDDTKDAGEIGAGHTVTALYEIIPADSDEKLAKPAVDKLKYQKEVEKTDAARSQEMLTVKLRYKEPDGEKSKLLQFPVKNQVVEFDAANVDLKFASSVAAFGMILRGSQFKGDADYDKVIRWSKSSLDEDEFNYREEFLKLVRTAKSLSNK